MTIELKINDNIPNFTLPLSDDSLFNSEELKKKLYIIYFYPKDNTPGCTNEAKDFSSLKKDFDEIDAEIIGISKDSIKKHKNFIEKQLLKILHLPRNLQLATILWVCTGHGLKAWWIFYEFSGAV